MEEVGLKLGLQGHVEFKWRKEGHFILGERA